MKKYAVISLLIHKISAFFETDLWTMQLFHNRRTKFLLFVQSIKITCTFLNVKLPKYRIFHWNFKKILQNFKNRDIFIFYESSSWNPGVSLIFWESWQLCNIDHPHRTRKGAFGFKIFLMTIVLMTTVVNHIN